MDKNGCVNALLAKGYIARNVEGVVEVTLMCQTDKDYDAKLEALKRELYAMHYHASWGVIKKLL